MRGDTSARDVLSAIGSSIGSLSTQALLRPSIRRREGGGCDTNRQDCLVHRDSEFRWKWLDRDPGSVIGAFHRKHRKHDQGRQEPSQLIAELAPAEPVRVSAELVGQRFDVVLTADRSENLIDVFRAVARQSGIEIENVQQLAPVIVLRPSMRSGEQLPSYASDVPRKHFSCSRCGGAELKQALERRLNQPVLLEAENLILSNVSIDWVDEASLAVALREGLGLQLNREQRHRPIWLVSARARERAVN